MLAVSQPEPSEQTLTPRERLALLCDRGSIHAIRSHVASNGSDGRSQAGDGVMGASATVGKRPVFVYAEDGRFAGGSLGQAHAKTITQVMELAGEARVPIIGFIESAGARMQEGAAALASYARVFRRTVQLSGKVPQISIVSGASAGGGWTTRRTPSSSRASCSPTCRRAPGRRHRRRRPSRPPQATPALRSPASCAASTTSGTWRGAWSTPVGCSSSLPGGPAT